MAKKAVLKKIFVLDTNVLLHDPMSLFRFQEHDLYIPFVTLEELDNHKVGTQDLNRNARQATRSLEQITTQEGSFAKGFAIQDLSGRKAEGKLYMQSTVLNSTKSVFGPEKNDNKFLEVLEHLQITMKSHEVTLVTKDLNLRVKARALGFASDDYLNDHAIEDSDLLYSGYRHLEENPFDIEGNVLQSWHADQTNYIALKADPAAGYITNEMLVLPEGPRWLVQDVREEGVTLRQMADYTKPKNNVWGINARNDEQSFALELLMNPDIHFITMLGQAGTGKTLLTLAAGLHQVLETKVYDEIIFTRVTVPMGEEIGFLPGTEEEKMHPWMGALHDNIEVLLNPEGESDWSGSVTKDELMRHVQVKSTTFMRGRTFVRKFLVIDEAQNLTPKQVKTLITRAANGTKVICMGNLAQIDTPYLSETSSGLAYAVERFKGWHRFGNIILPKGERSELATYANEVL